MAIAILYARRGALEAKAPVDAMLVFGVPLVGFALQASLVYDTRYGVAWSALAIALVYGVLARALLRRRRGRVRPAGARVPRAGGDLRHGGHPVRGRPAVDDGTGGRWRRPACTGSACRQRQPLARGFALLLQLAAAVGLTAYASAAATARPPAHQGAADQTDTGAPSAGLPAAGYAAADQARHLVAEIAQLRGQVPYVEPAEDEIAEPVTDSAAFLACARVIDAAVSQALDALCSGLPAARYQGRHTR